MKPETVEIKDLALGDVIRLGGWEYADATVRRINDDGSVQVVRPYIRCADFSYTGGVMTYIGTEDFAIYSGPVTRVKRGGPLR